MNTKENNNLLIQVVTSTLKKVLTVKGVYSKNGHRDYSSGCLGRPMFKVEEIQEINVENDLKNS